VPGIISGQGKCMTDLFTDDLVWAGGGGGGGGGIFQDVLSPKRVLFWKNFINE